MYFSEKKIEIETNLTKIDNPFEHGSGKEYIIKIKSNNITDSNQEFFTDSNGLFMI